MPITELLIATFHGEDRIEGKNLVFEWNENDPDSDLQIKDEATDLVIALYAAKTWRSVKVISQSQIEEPEQSEGGDEATPKTEAA